MKTTVMKMMALAALAASALGACTYSDPRYVYAPEPTYQYQQAYTPGHAQQPVQPTQPIQPTQPTQPQETPMGTPDQVPQMDPNYGTVLPPGYYPQPEPQQVYVQPQPVYVQQEPIYVQQEPVYVSPPPVVIIGGGIGWRDERNGQVHNPGVQDHQDGRGGQATHEVNPPRVSTYPPQPLPVRDIVPPPVRGGSPDRTHVQGPTAGGVPAVHNPTVSGNGGRPTPPEHMIAPPTPVAPPVVVGPRHDGGHIQTTGPGPVPTAAPQISPVARPVPTAPPQIAPQPPIAAPIAQPRVAAPVPTVTPRLTLPQSNPGPMGPIPMGGPRPAGPVQMAPPKPVSGPTPSVTPRLNGAQTGSQPGGGPTPGAGYVRPDGGRGQGPVGPGR